MNEPVAAPARVDKLRVLLCHEVPLVRSGLRAIVNAENDMTVVGEAGNAEEAVPLLDQMKPEVIVSDLTIDGGGGLDTIRRIKNEAPWIRLLILAHDHHVALGVNNGPQAAPHQRHLVAQHHAQLVHLGGGRHRFVHPITPR